jgi:co-chaperonin GroES (HSP10)
MTKTTMFINPRPVIEGKIIGKVSQNGTIIGLMVKTGQRITMMKYSGSV